MKKRIQIVVILLFSAFILHAQKPNEFKHKDKQQQTIDCRKLSGTTINPYSSQNTNRYVSKPLHVSPHIQLPKLLKDSIINVSMCGSRPIYFEKIKSPNIVSKKPVEKQFYDFHENAKNRTHLTNPTEELQILSIACDTSRIIHIKAQQYFKHIKVYGAESYMHISAKKDIFNGTIYNISDSLSIIPSLQINDVLQIVTSDITKKVVCKDLNQQQKQILQYNEPTTELIIFDSKLAYEIMIRPNFKENWRYIVDAHTGTIIRSYNISNSDGPATATAIDLNNETQTINTYLENSMYVMRNASESMYNSLTQEGVIETFNANYTSYDDLSYSPIESVNNTWDIPAAVSAQYHTSLTYRYFKNTFNRNSINGQGGDIISFINVNEVDGSSMENAFWNGQVAFYGNGGTDFFPLAGALDVVAHELGHGVISTTANLDYYGQPGAINESYADIFGAMVDRQNWLIGERVTKPSFCPSGALRNMADPHNMGTSEDYYWQPKHTSEMYIGSDDNGGVHTNSGIVNYAYYLLATSVTKEKAERIFYKALINYLTVNTQFTELRLAVTESARELYGESAVEVQEVKNAFDSVGIYEEEAITYSSEYQVNPGTEYLITYDTDDNTTATLYRSTSDGSDFNPLSSTEMKGGVSITDDGSAAVFVGNDSKIKILSTDPYNIDELNFSEDTLYDNVAISRDGNRMAAISRSADASIYVYDFESDQWKQFHLYNPTTSDQGINAGGVLYADAIEFDHTGEYIMYDAENQLNSTTGEDLTYWDIGFIRVWDNETNTFADGEITKLFNSLPENISIGNPTFSKNSPDIIAYDYLDLVNNDFAVMGANINTGQSDIIALNNTLGFPSYNKYDNVVAYSSYDSYYGEIVALVDLNSNKISQADLPYPLVSSAQWPVFYSVGTRLLVLPPAANFTADVRSGEVPLSVQFIDQSLNDPYSWSWAFQGGIPATSTEQNPVVTYNRAGIFHVALTCSNLAGVNTNTKLSYISVSYHVGLESEVREIISLYPNPAHTELKVDCKSDCVVSLYTLTGLQVAHEINPQKIDISQLPKGAYIVKIEVEGEVLTDTIIKE